MSHLQRRTTSQQRRAFTRSTWTDPPKRVIPWRPLPRENPDSKPPVDQGLVRRNGHTKSPNLTQSRSRNPLKPLDPNTISGRSQKNRTARFLTPLRTLGLQTDRTPMRSSCVQPLRKPEHLSMCAICLLPKQQPSDWLATGYRELLPRFMCLSAKSDVRIVALACLTNTIRSQSFSPSQRFDPRTSLRLYFAPHPLIGFQTFRAFPTKASRCASRHSLLSCHYALPLHRMLCATASCATAPRSQGNAIDFKALLRLGVRTLPAPDYRYTKPLLSWPFSSPRLAGPLADLQEASPHVLDLRVRRTKTPRSHFEPVLQGIKPIEPGFTPEGAKPTSMRFFTLHKHPWWLLQKSRHQARRRN